MDAEAWACEWPRWRVDADVLRADADEYKGKRKRKKGRTLLVGMVRVLCVDVLACRHGCWWWAYADGGGCGWWWMRMVVDADVTDTDVAESARLQDLDNFVQVSAATTHY